MYRNVSYLILGVVFGALLGAILGILVCDETKRAIMRAIQKRAKVFTHDCKATVDNVKGSVKDVLS